MSDVYFLRVTGDGHRKLAEALAEKANESDFASDDNLIIVPEEIEPLDRDEAMEYLEGMADALDMTVEDDESS